MLELALLSLVVAMITDAEDQDLDLDQTKTDAFLRWFGNSKVVDEQGKPLVLYRGVRRKIGSSGWMATTHGRATLSFTDDPKVANVYALQLETRTYRGGSSVMPVYLSMQKPLDLRKYGKTIRLDEILNELPWNFEQDFGGSKFVGKKDLIEAIENWDEVVDKDLAHFEIEVGVPSIWYKIDTFKELADHLYDLNPEDFSWTMTDVEVDTYLLGDSESFVRLLERLGYDGIIHEDVFDVGEKLYEGEPPERVVSWRPFRQNQVKSAIGNRGTFDPEDHRIDYGSEKSFELRATSFEQREQKHG